MTALASDRFSFRSALYARSRPTYPDLMMQWLRGRTARGESCWDVGTGTGQVAGLAAEYFDRVYATDVSAAQLEEAPITSGVTYAVEPAECSTLPADSVDAVLVGAAAHWLNLPDFYREVRRVCRPGGMLAMFSYGIRVAGEPELQAVIDRYASTILVPWWSQRLAMVEAAYKPIAFPFDEIAFPTFAASSFGDLQSLENLLRTWSAAQQMAKATGTDPVASIQADLHHAWTRTAAAHIPRTLRWPIFARVGRVHPR
jgi:ubiquinone/menaquinone biosynthesis C-methylase UbiE